MQLPQFDFNVPNLPSCCDFESSQLIYTIDRDRLICSRRSCWKRNRSTYEIAFHLSRLMFELFVCGNNYYHSRFRLRSYEGGSPRINKSLVVFGNCSTEICADSSSSVRNSIAESFDAWLNNSISSSLYDKQITHKRYRHKADSY